MQHDAATPLRFCHETMPFLELGAHAHCVYTCYVYTCTRRQFNDFIMSLPPRMKFGYAWVGIIEVRITKDAL